MPPSLPRLRAAGQLSAHTLSWMNAGLLAEKPALPEHCPFWRVMIDVHIVTKIQHPPFIKWSLPATQVQPYELRGSPQNSLPGGPVLTPML